MFLYIVPLKQGLKLKGKKGKNRGKMGFLYIVPLKQGLKLSASVGRLTFPYVFIHSSIKTRIET